MHWGDCLQLRRVPKQVLNAVILMNQYICDVGCTDIIGIFEFGCMNEREEGKIKISEATLCSGGYVISRLTALPQRLPSFSSSHP
jgi:hypothetical protein